MTHRYPYAEIWDDDMRLARRAGSQNLWRSREPEQFAAARTAWRDVLHSDAMVVRAAYRRFIRLCHLATRRLLAADSIA